MKLRRWLRGIGIGLAVVIGIVALVIGILLVRFNRAANRVYDVPPPNIVVSRDSAVLERGRHLAEAVGGCVGCHGQGLKGQLVDDLGPIGIMYAPNLTSGRGGLPPAYTDGDLARAIKHGIRRDGRSTRFMPSWEFNWWPDPDLVAMVSYIRTLPPIDNQVEPTRVRTLGKLLDQAGMLPLLVARGIDHDAPPEDVPDPEPTTRYGRFLARNCQGCHGETLAGGRIPGSPASIPTPRNLTLHATGLAEWTESDFVIALTTGVRPDGTRLDPFMPTFMAYDEVERRALWAFLQSLPPRETGRR